MVLTKKFLLQKFQHSLSPFSLALWILVVKSDTKQAGTTARKGELKRISILSMIYLKNPSQYLYIHDIIMAFTNKYHRYIWHSIHISIYIYIHMISDDKNQRLPIARCLSDQPTPSNTSNLQRGFRAPCLESLWIAEGVTYTTRGRGASMEDTWGIPGRIPGIPWMTMGVDGLPWHPPEN